MGAGSGITARACLSLGIPWVGLCWNPVHAHWLNNVVDRWALEEIVRKKSPLHEQDLAAVAKLVNTHFSDVLQQIQDQDQKTAGEDGISSEDEESDDGAPALTAAHSSVSHCRRSVARSVDDAWPSASTPGRLWRCAPRDAHCQPTFTAFTWRCADGIRCDLHKLLKKNK